MADNLIARRPRDSIRDFGRPDRSKHSQSPDHLAAIRDDRVRGQWELLRAIEKLDETVAESLLRWLRIGGYGDDRKLAPLERWKGFSEVRHRAHQRKNEQARFRRLLDYVLPDDRIFDVGCGLGYVAGILLRDGGISSYCGIDVGAHRVKVARQMAEHCEFADRPVHLEPLSVFDLTADFMRPHRPTLILVLEVLEHLHNPQEALETVARAAPPDASILFSVPMLGRLETCKGHLSTFDADRLIDLCQGANLIAQQVEPIRNTWTFVLAAPETADLSRVMARCKQNPPGASRQTEEDGNPEADAVTRQAETNDISQATPSTGLFRRCMNFWKNGERRVENSRKKDGFVCHITERDDVSAVATPTREEKMINCCAVLVGGMKCGTTSLNAYVRQHPEIATPKSKKDVHFFSGDENWERGWQWYWRRWEYDPAMHKVAYESTTQYAKFPQYTLVAERMAQIDRELKLLYLLRNPLDRIESHLAHNVARGHATLEECRKTMGRAIQFSSYAMQIGKFREFLPEVEILLLDFAELKADPRNLLRKVEDFLCVSHRDYEIVPPQNTRKTVHGSERVQLTDEDRRHVISELGPDVRVLRDEFGFDVSSWDLI